MKRRILLIVFSCVVLVLCAAGFDLVGTLRASPVPVPSTPGGYYDAPFTLTLCAPPNGSIYYTTDGSAPTTDSILYEGGILLEDRSPCPNVCAAVQNIVADWKSYTPNPEPVEKGTVIRAIFVNQFGIESEILTQTYFIGVSPPEQGMTLSIVFAFDDLFGDNGIYVTGAEYDAQYLAGGETPVPNFEKDMEVAVTAELMDESGDILNQLVGLRIQGASNRASSRKRFTITAREEYSGSNVFDAQLYEGVTTHSVMLKRPLPDAIVADLVMDRSVAVQRSIPVRVFLNGEFWYDCYMLERYDEQYFRQHYQVDDRVLIKNGTAKCDSNQEMEQFFYEDFIAQVSATDYSDPDNWVSFQREADVQSYIDYIVTNYYLCNYDVTDTHNCVLWCSPSQGKQRSDTARWRWCIYDIDALNFLNTDRFGAAETVNLFSLEDCSDMNDSTLFRALRRSPEFCQLFVLSFMDMLNNNFAPENVEKVLADYGYTLDWMDGFFRKRPDYAIQHLAGEFGLSGSLETVTVQTDRPEMGYVVVNTSRIDLSSGSWTGQYFTDYPITVTAVANDGFQFLGWKGDASGANAVLTVPVGDGITLEAVFAKNE